MNCPSVNRYVKKTIEAARVHKPKGEANEGKIR
jgi:hypothetical protein